MERELPLKSLQVCIRLAIMIFDSENNFLEEFKCNKMGTFFYNYKKMLEDTVEENRFFYFLSGRFDEMFLLYIYENKKYLFGPFRCNVIDKTFFDKKMVEQQINLTDRKYLYEHLKTLNLFTLGEMRDILCLVHYFFTGKTENLLQEEIYNLVLEITEEVEMSDAKNLLSPSFEPELYLSIYENKILKCVEFGDTQGLRDIIFKLSGGVVPMVSGDSIRSEKNYSIVIFEKLSEIAIKSGVDVVLCYQAKENLIRKNELANSLDEILHIRDSSILFFTKEIKEIKKLNLSPLVSSIVQYIKVNIQKKITVAEISEYFKLSESKIRTTFKNEMKVTISNYISECKISKAKNMLKTDCSISEIAFSLGFADSSHLSKVFKKVTGYSPKQYKQLMTKISD